MEPDNDPCPKLRAVHEEFAAGDLCEDIQELFIPGLAGLFEEVGLAGNHPYRFPGMAVLRILPYLCDPEE